ncbi:Tachykinin-like peptides receptor 86C [Bagarius yarrelli]|uniref:Tachykinin-like peptides receptor 86C n=1 Tax=Bagarius yarrelli TaxID=175774 RepID=A0A556V0L9_BAGYA|nr:Tachykinin-like peptides receptor 86C [Bagarius yarrelli]
MISNFTYPWENLNNNTWQYKVQVAILVTNCTVLLVTFFVGITANLFVTYAVYNQKSLQTSTNALLVNLAVIDLLRSATDCPLLLVVVLNKNKTRDLGDLVCDGQVMSFSFSCCVQLFTLASISAERHQAIANPFKTAERRKRVKVWIPLTWAVAVVVSAMCVMFTKDSSVYLRCKALHWDKLKTYGSFGRYVLLPVWFVCLALIVGFYSHIFILVKAHNRKIFDKGVSTPTYKKVPEDKKKVEDIMDTKVSVVNEPVAPKEIYDTQIMQEANEQENGTESSNRESEEQMTLTTVAEGQLLDTKTSDVKTEDPFAHPNQRNLIVVSELQHNTTELIDLENSCNNSGNLSEDAEKPSSDQVPSALTDQQHFYELNNPITEMTDPRNGGENQDDPSKHAEKANSEQVPQEADKGQTASAGQTIEVIGDVCMMPSFANKERGSKKKESRLAKRSGYIICTFLVLWMPLIGTVVLNTFINRKQIWEEIEVLVVSISCMTSLTNPIIYAAVNPQFRTEFYSMRARFKAYCIKA